MAIAQSKITTQGQISIPAEVRKKLGVGPGATIEWDESNDQVVVRRVGQHSSADVHQALFGTEQAVGGASTKDGIRQKMRKKHARD
jgi:AbrB family looped-hinge helix DNA binding protein